MENHHPAIVSRETFEEVAAVISQRGKEKGVTSGSKYQNRYPLSGRIVCSECGSMFERRIHYSTHQKYIAWCCSRHIEKKGECSMQFIRNDAVEAAFTTMMNKLVYGHRKILRPLLDSLRRVDDEESCHRVSELEDRIEAVMERGQVLSVLIAKGYLESVLSNKEKNELAAAGQIRQIFRSYLEGDSLTTAAKKAGVISCHGGISRMLKNKHYLGDEYYPAIIDRETFDRAEQERMRRAAALGRIKEPVVQEKIQIPTVFHTKLMEQTFDDPFL